MNEVGAQLLTHARLSELAFSAPRFWYKALVGTAQSDELGPCLVWTAARNDEGYGIFWHERRFVLAHRMAFFLARGRWPNGVARHRCDNPACVWPGHLLEGSHADNVADRVARGRTARGSRSGSARLDEQAVAFIRSSHERGEHDVKALAAMFLVSTSAIRAVISRQNWR